MIIRWIVAFASILHTTLAEALPEEESYNETGKLILSSFAHTCSSKTFKELHEIYRDKDILERTLRLPATKLEGSEVHLESGRVSAVYDGGVVTLRIGSNS